MAPSASHTHGIAAPLAQPSPPRSQEEPGPVYFSSIPPELGLSTGSAPLLLTLWKSLLFQGQVQEAGEDDLPH